MRATVLLFKPSGKYYTEEKWAVPERVPDFSPQRGNYMRAVMGPYDLEHSPDFRRIDGGAVLVVTQEPWGFPHLFPGGPLGLSDRLERPATWERETGIRVLDEDGWRRHRTLGPRDWDTPITQAEFHQRVVLSTVEHVARAMEVTRERGD